MDVIYLTGEQLTVGWIVTRIRAEERTATFFLKQAFALRPDRPAASLPEDQPSAFPSGDTPMSDQGPASIYYASDFAPQKPRADVLLHATAHAPKGRPVPTLDVSFQVGRFSKSLRVFGDRKWQFHLLRGHVLADAEPFASMPLVYERAFGGPDSARNPVGRGRGANAEFAPNIESPQEPVRSPQDKLEPAGFGPLAAQWQQRRSLAGTYDQKWLKERWPWFPADFDWSYFNAAPRDQQMDGYLRGDESLRFDNLHPVHAVYRSQLPGLAARCFLYERLENGQAVFREVPLKLDTLWIDLNIERLILVWRGTAPVRTVKLREVERVIVATEPLAKPKTPQEYHAAMRALLEAKEAEFALEEDTSAEDEATDREFAEMEAEFAGMEKEFADIDARLLQDEASQREHFLAQEVPLAVLNRSAEEANSIPIDGRQLSELREVRPQMAADVEQMNAEAASAGEFEAEFDAEFAAAEAEFPDEPPVTRESVIAAHRDGVGLAGVDASELDLSGLTLDGVDFSGATLTGASLQNTSLIGARFKGADLSKANLEGAKLAGAVLDDATFTDAILKGAVLTGISVNGTDLTKLDLKGQDLSGCKGKYADFSGADLSAAKFRAVDLNVADFSGAKLEKTDFTGAKLKDCDFSEVNARGIVMEGADAAGLRSGQKADFTQGNFRGVRAPGSVWETCLLDGSDFSKAVLAGAELPDASAKNARFDRADLTGANFADAQLNGAKFTRCNLLRASFERADVRRASFEGSNLYQAGFFEATTDEAEFQGANLKQTLLAR